MKTLSQIETELSNLGYESSFMVKKEIQELPNILRSDESIKAITNGAYDGNTWLVVCTDERFLFLDKGFLFGLKQVEFPMDKVNSIQFSTGLLLGDVTICTGSSKCKIDNVEKKQARKFADLSSKALEDYKSSKTKNTSNNTIQMSKVEQLEKLASLKKEGILTDEEFAEEKRRILAA